MLFPCFTFIPKAEVEVFAVRTSLQLGDERCSKKSNF